MELRLKRVIQIPEYKPAQINRAITEIRRGITIAEASRTHLGNPWALRRLWNRDSEVKAKVDKARADARAARLKEAHGTLRGYRNYKCHCPRCSVVGLTQARKHAQRTPMSRPQKLCSVCGVLYSLNGTGVIRRHDRSVRHGSDYVMTPCPGSRKPPKDADG
jgi:hypothetical protein